VEGYFPVGEVVKAWRTARSLTVTQLAERAGRPMTKGYISGLERGRIQHPGQDHLERIAHALDIPVLYLVLRRLPDSTRQGQGSGESGHEKGFTFGSGLPVAGWQGARSDLLRGILQQTEEITRRVEELARRAEELRQLAGELLAEEHQG